MPIEGMMVSWWCLSVHWVSDALVFFKFREGRFATIPERKKLPGLPRGRLVKKVMLRFLSLRVKLMLLAALIVCLACAPVIYLGYRDAYESSEKLALEKFNSVSRIVDEETKLAYLNAQATLASKVGIEKDNLRDLSDLAEAMLEAGEVRPLVSLMNVASGGGTHVALFSAQGKILFTSDLLAAAFKSGVRDYLGESIAGYAKTMRQRRQREFISYFEYTDENARIHPMLFSVRVGTRHTIFMAAEIDYIQDAKAERIDEIESNLRDMVRLLPIDDQMTVVVQNSVGTILAGKGPLSLEGIFDKRPEIYNEALTKGSAQGVLDDEGVAEDLLYVVRYFKALDCYMQITLPMEEVARPAQIYAMRVMAIVGVIFLVVACFGLWLVSVFLQPLKRVAVGAKRLERVNFSECDISERLQRILKDLPRGEKDEVGQVSSAFFRMVQALEKNIADLKKSLLRQHGMEGELNAAREIQRGMLPAGDGHFASAGFEADALMDPAREVGGDFFDVFESADGRKVLVMGDVSGKGVSAALLMSCTLTLVRTASGEDISPAAVMKRVNDNLARSNPSCMFVTLWIGLFDPKTGHLVFANGAHCPPAVLSRRTGKVRWLTELSGPLVGVMDVAEFIDREVDLGEDEVCFVYTDGVSEAMNERRELFGAKRIEQALVSRPIGHTKEVLQVMMDAIVLHRGTADQSDDITMLAFAREGGEASDE